MKDVAVCDKLRGGDKQPLIRRSLNGETRRGKPASSMPEFIGYGRQLGEVKHLSSRRKRKNYFLRFVSFDLSELSNLRIAFRE